MTPAEFIERLTRHYAKRHDNDHARALWVREMVDSLKGTDPAVLDKAYDLVRDEYEERAFPLVATLKKFIARAAEIIYRDDNRGTTNSYRGPSMRAPDSPEWRQTVLKAREWQKETIRRYGLWEGYWRATRHSYVKPGQRVRERFAPDVPAEVRNALPCTRARRMRLPRKPLDTSRTVMHLLMQNSPNQYLYKRQP